MGNMIYKQMLWLNNEFSLSYGTDNWLAKSVIVVYKYFKWKLLFILYRNKSTDLQEVWKNKNTWILIRLLGEISITSDMQMIPPLWQKVKN